ncbi:MAG: tetratricopeptide repeat protein [Acidobacteriota bacterium]
MVFCCSLLLTAGSLEAQRIQNILFGDLKVDQPEGVNVPQSFWLVLKDLQGHPLNRDSVAANGRYRFFNVSNGEYVLSVEVNGQEVYRDQFIVNKDSNDFEAWTELGTAQFQEKKLDDAAKAYEKSLEQKPDYLPALVNLGKLRLAQKKFDQAVEPLEKAVAQDPQRAESQYLLGEAYLGILGEDRS